uniref:Uncharacterized protein n=1 Tax=Rhizophora mucronata TaxID=61149 RepID=A0A2P2N997_RHIMU
MQLFGQSCQSRTSKNHNMRLILSTKILTSSWYHYPNSREALTQLIAYHPQISKSFS